MTRHRDTPEGAEHWRVLEGSLSLVQSAPARTSLAEAIQGRIGTRLGGALAAAAWQRYGDCLDWVDGSEDHAYFENMAVVVADEVVCATFSGVELLREGDWVRMVVRPNSRGSLSALIIHRPADGLVLTQYPQGYAVTKRRHRGKWLVSLGCLWLFLIGMFVIIGWLDGRGVPSSLWLGALLVGPFMARMFFFDVRADGRMGSMLFLMLGFTQPDEIWLEHDWSRSSGRGYVYSYRDTYHAPHIVDGVTP